MNPAYHKLKKQMGVSTKYTGDYRDAYRRAVSDEEKIQVDKILGDLESDYQAGEIGALIGTAVTMVFDFNYQEIKEIGKNVGDAVADFFGGIGNAIFN